MFTTEYKLLNDLFARDIKYKIPSYQRPYSWECLGISDKNNQINTFWDDLLEHYEGNDKNPYFMGSMVFMGKEENRDFEVIDGQQRLTSLVILFVSIKCFLTDIKDKNQYDEKIEDFLEEAVRILDSFLFDKVLLGATIKEKKVRIEHNQGFDFDKVLKLIMGCSENSEYLINEMNYEEKEICMRYFNNRSYFIDKIKDNFLENSVLTYEKALSLNNFIEFLKNRVAVIRVLTEKFDMAYQIFEILNNRGLQLSNKDLVRNQMQRTLQIKLGTT